jgi:phenylacetate-CoA ligase
MSSDYVIDEVKAIEALNKKIAHVISQAIGLNAKIKIVEPMTLKRSEGKAVHVIDNRKIY